MERPVKHEKYASELKKMKTFYINRYNKDLTRKVEAISQTEVQKKKDAVENVSRTRNKPVQSAKVTKVEDKQDYMRNMPKSKYYKTIEMEEKMKKIGLLVNKRQIENFRRKMQTADDFEEALLEAAVDMQVKTAADRTPPSSMRIGGLQEEFRPMSEIKEVRSQEASRPITRPAASPNKEVVLNPLAGRREKTPSEIARAAAISLDKRCPKMELPTLYCYELDLSKPEMSAVEKALVTRQQEQEEKTKANLTRLKRMYNMSQSNAASCIRILNNKPNMFMFNDDIQPAQAQTPDIEERYLEPSGGNLAPNYTDDDLYADQGMFEDHYSEPMNFQLSPHREYTLSIPAYALFTPIQEEDETGLSSGRRTGVSSRKLPDIRGVKHQAKPHDYEALSLHSLLDTKKTLETHATSFWPNYLQVGKSKFSSN